MDQVLDTLQTNNTAGDKLEKLQESMFTLRNRHLTTTLQSSLSVPTSPAL